MGDTADQVDLWMDRAMDEMGLRLEREAEITRLRAALADAQARSYTLAVAIMGGEDAPGLADATDAESLADQLGKERAARDGWTDACVKAATADAQAVGFAAGVEAAAKYIDRRVSNYVDEHGIFDGETGVTEFPGNGEEWVWDQEETAEAIRALTPPDATAAAARVLLADDAAMDTMSDYEHRQWAGWFRHQLEQSTPENIERWKRQADMPFALLSAEEKAVDRRFADAALRAIAGDTP